MLTSEGETNMALIPCPDCGENVSDQAPVCPKCGLPVAAHLQRMKEEEEARIVQEEAEQEAERQRIANGRHNTLVGIVVAIIAIALIGSCVSSQSKTSSTENILFQIATQSSITPGNNAFSANGKLKIDYACQSNINSTANILFTLVDINSSSTVWKKSVKCSANSSGSTDAIQVKTDTYDVGASINGNANWSMTITQE